MAARSDSPFQVVIPVIDVVGYLQGDPTETAQIAIAIRDACKSPGFFQITGHGVPPELRADLLAHLKLFFALPASSKKALHRDQSKCLRGYESVGEQSLEAGFSDQKEGFMIGREALSEKRFLQGPNQWPNEADVPGFRETFMTYFSAMQGLSLTLFRLMALSLDLDETYFDNFLTHEACTVSACCEEKHS